MGTEDLAGYLAAVVLILAGTGLTVRWARRRPRLDVPDRSELSGEARLRPIAPETYDASGRPHVHARGKHRGHDYVLETFLDSTPSARAIEPQRLYTRVRVAPVRAEVRDGIPGDRVARIVGRLPGRPGGVLAWDPATGILAYEEPGLECSEAEIEDLLDIACDLVEILPTIQALGGAALPFLDELAEHDAAEPVAYRWLEALAEESRARFGDDPRRFICPRCLVRFAPHVIDPPGRLAVIVHGCRACLANRDPLQGRVVAVLDAGEAEEVGTEGDEVRASWSLRRRLFDFDEVHVVVATDADVEQLAIQIENDAHHDRERRVRCTVGPGSGITEAGMRILERTFEEVVRCS